MYLPEEDFLEFAKEYVTAAGSSLDEVTFQKGSSALGLVDISGMVCVQCRQDPLGYEIFEFEDESGEKVLLMNCRMTSRWVSVQ